MGTLSPPVFQLFINFRGKDIRYGFVSHLKDALKRHNINFFMDTCALKGTPLKHLFTKIEQSTVGLVILSTRYAESKWCLEELSKIMEQAEKGRMIAIPIFYKVKPNDVRKQKGEFGEKFMKRTKKSSREEIQKWQMALKAVSNNFGYTLDTNRSEAKFIKKVIRDAGKFLTAHNFVKGREKECVNKVTTFSIVVTIPWAWFSSAVGLICALVVGFSFLAKTVHRCAAPAMLALVGSVVARSSSSSSSCCWVDKTI